MINIKKIAMPIAIVFILCTYSTAKDLGEFPVNSTLIDADLIVEGTLKNGDIVIISRVYFGSKKKGDEIVVKNLERLPRDAFEKVAFTFNRKKTEQSISTDGATALFILEKNKKGNTYRPCWYGSGVKWILKKRVYGYTQPINPGPYQLVIDNNHSTLKELRLVLTKGLKKRQEFKEVLLEKNAKLQAKKLSKYLHPPLSYNYFSKASSELQKLGHSGAIVLMNETVRPEQIAHRSDLIRAIGMMNNRKSVPFLKSIIEEARQTLIHTKGKFDRTKVGKKELLAHNDWTAALSGVEKSGNPGFATQFREAAMWGAKHQRSEMLECSIHGMGITPCKQNLVIFKKILSILPEDDDGFGKWATYHVLLSLNGHGIKETIPLIASILDHPDEYNRRVARAGLKKLVGKDLGEEQKPWLDWYSQNKKKATK